MSSTVSILSSNYFSHFSFCSSGLKRKGPESAREEWQFLYKNGGLLALMHPETFDQVTLLIFERRHNISVLNDRHINAVLIWLYSLKLRRIWLFPSGMKFHRVSSTLKVQNSSTFVKNFSKAYITVPADGQMVSVDKLDGQVVGVFRDRKSRPANWIL